MILSINPSPSKITISFNKEDYIEDEFRIILNSLVQYRTLYTIESIDSVIENINKHLENYPSLTLKVFNDLNVKMYGVIDEDTSTL